MPLSPGGFEQMEPRTARFLGSLYTRVECSFPIGPQRICTSVRVWPMIDGMQPRSRRFSSVLVAGWVVVAGLGLARSQTRTQNGAVVIEGRFVDEHGTPVSTADVEATLDEWSRTFISVSLAPLRDDGNGGFRIMLDVSDKGVERKLLVIVKRGKLGARLDVSEMGAGTHRVGDVRVAPPPALVTGRVLGPDGTPAPGIDVRLDRRWMGARDGAPTWNTAYVNDTTDREGRYQLRGWVGTDELRVEASGRNLGPVGRECRAGASGVELTLVACGAIRGSVLLDAPCGAGALVIECVRHTPAHEAVVSTFPPPGGAFLVDGLPHGSYDLRFRAQDDIVSLASVEGIEARSSEDTGDPRVAALDLRGRLRCMHVRVELPAGVEPPFALVHVRHSSTEDYRARWVPGSFEVATGAPSLDLVLDAPGWRLERLSGVDSDRSVTLRPGLPVRLVLQGGPPALPAGFDLRADLEPMTSELRRYGCRFVAFDSRGTALVRASEPGEHRARIAVHRVATDEDYPLPAKAISPAAFGVAENEGDTERLLPVELDAAALAHLVEELSKTP